MPSYSIEARSYRIAIACSHNFWVLKNADRDTTIAELHGLAYDRVSGRILPIGTNRNHSLRVFMFPHDADYAASVGMATGSTRMFARSRARAIYRGADGLDRWQAAVNAMPFLDGLDLTYPPYGFNVLTPTVNSNSAYRTFGEIMDVPVYYFPGTLGPGLRSRMIAPSEIAKLQPRQSESAAA